MFICSFKVFMQMKKKTHACIDGLLAKVASVVKFGSELKYMFGVVGTFSTKEIPLYSIQLSKTKCSNTERYYILYIHVHIYV